MKLDPTQFCYLNFDIKARTQGVGGTYKLFCDKRFQGFLQCGLVYKPHYGLLHREDV